MAEEVAPKTYKGSQVGTGRVSSYNWPDDEEDGWG